jgi:transposase
VFHHKEERADGHLFITVLAYQFVQIIRRRLKESGIDLSWNSIRRIILKNQLSLILPKMFSINLTSQ